MYKVGVCGNFGSQKNVSNGQIVKTRIVTDELKRYFGKEQVISLDTDSWKKNPIKLLMGCIKLVFSCQNILILPAQNGIKVFAPLFKILSTLVNRKLHYSVIGGWLPEYVEGNKYLLKNLKFMDAIYVETHTMEKKLKSLGLNNIYYMPNFKDINLVQENEMPKTYDIPYALCTFSRVKKEKGIIDAINAVKTINQKMGKKIFTIDIYGTVESGFEEEFKIALSNSNEGAEYKGLVQFDKSTDVLKNYFALVFPTYYEGEGFPGTIIDAFSSGVPVIASDWKYNKEIVSDNKTGIIYKLNKNKEIGLIEILEDIYINPQKIMTMKNNCLKEANKYDASIVMKVMIQKMGE